MHIQHPPTTPEHDPLILPPLDVALPSPFHSPPIPRAAPPFPPLTSTHLPRLSSSSTLFLDNETPTTAVASLPTPGPSPVTLYGSQNRTYADVVRGCGNIDSWPDIDDNGTQLADPNDLGLSGCPPAPRIKDLDTFTDGTGAGSFDFSLYSSQEELSQSQLSLMPEPTSKSFSPEPLRSIESWRDSVMTEASSRAEAQEEMEGACEMGEYGTPGPRGLKRHLSLSQSDGEDCYDRGAERAKGRWAASMAPYMGNYDYAFLDDHTHDDDGGDIDELYYRSDDEEAGYVRDGTNQPPRPASAPPYV